MSIIGQTPSRPQPTTRGRDMHLSAYASSTSDRLKPHLESPVSKQTFVHGSLVARLIQRADGFTDICEMKHSVNTFTIDKNYAKELQNKIDAYQELSKDNRTLHLVMVTTNGVVHNNYYNMIQNEITMDDLFAI